VNPAQVERRSDESPPRDAVLEARGLTAGYGRQAVIHGMDLHVGRGEVVALLGANGAGKTTTLLTLAGELPAMSGDVLLDGAVNTKPLHQRARSGLSFVTEERSVFRGLSTADNLKVADVAPERALAMFPELEPRMDIRGGLLSGGEQQMLTLARALGRDPRLLLADELSLGLAPLIVRRLFEALRKAAAELGVGVLLVEQHIRSALRYADRIYVMRRGRIELSGSAEEMRKRASEIEHSYLAGPVETPPHVSPDGAAKNGEGGRAGD
jgi:branched-chain amino acid transport system ATP-binding protein